MQVNFEGTILAPGGLLGEPGGLRLNGSPITEAAVFFRAVSMTWFARGNTKTEIGFAITRSFSSSKEAGLFACTHINGLAGRGDLILTIGEGGDTETVTLHNAVLQSVDPHWEGVTVRVEYKFSGGVFS